MSKEGCIVISIKPKWVDLIFSGKKTIELRRSFSNKIDNGAQAIIYSSAPVSAIVGTVIIKSVEKNTPVSIWSKFSKETQASKAEFDTYYDGRGYGIALTLSEPKRLPNITLDSLRERYNFTPPVSWRFLKESEIGLKSLEQIND